MTYQFYLGEPMHNVPQHEAMAVRVFARDIHFRMGEQFCAVAFNVRVDKHQLDAVFFTERAVTVLDWKNTYTSKITGDEKTPWLRHDKQPVLAGKHINPYQQMRVARGIVSNCLRRYVDNDKLSGRAFSQVGAAVVFTPAQVETDLQLSQEVNSWFTVTGLPEVVPWLKSRNSELNLSRANIEQVIVNGFKAQHWEEIELTLPPRTVGMLTHEGGKTYALHLSFVLGRAGDMLRLLGNKVSRRHAMVNVAGGDAYISDLGSTNGTFINDERLIVTAEAQNHIPRRLRDGDWLTLGGQRGQPGVEAFQFSIETQASALLTVSNAPPPTSNPSPARRTVS